MKKDRGDCHTCRSRLCRTRALRRLMHGGRD